MTSTAVSETSQVNQRTSSPMGPKENARRNARILAFAKQNARKLSYQLIGDRFGVSRDVVAGILFRARHPHKKRIRSPNGNGRNKIGGGRKPPPYIPEKCALGCKRAKR